MKITATLNGVKVKKNIPTHWGGVTFKQFFDLIGKDEIDILAYILEIDKDTLRKAKISNLEDVLNCLSFMQRHPKDTIPPTILGYDVPTNLEFETIGQYEDVKAELAKLKDPNEKDLIALYPLFVGTYTMRHYDCLKVDEFSKQFWQAPCGEVMAIGNFTLLKLRGLKRPSKITRLLGVIQRTRLAQAIRNWLRNLAFTVRYSSWKYRHNINDTN